MDTDELIGLDLEHYRVVDRLGEGGMAVVYRARDLHLNRLVAVKVLRLYQLGISAATQGFIKRFEREAHTLARLQHPNIVPIIDFGTASGKFPYLVMPLLTGGTLKDKTGAPMPYPRAAHLLAPVAGALAYAHHAGIIHRDIKPTNILLTESGEPMLSDFGIARFIQEESMSLTASGAFVGTPGYMAPEQWQGKVLPQTDIFALGVAFYELVTAHNPYNADTPQEVLYKQLIAPLPDPRQYVPDLPAPVVAALERALAKEPQDRYPNMDDFGVLLREFASASRTTAGRRPAPDQPVGGPVPAATVDERIPGSGEPETALGISTPGQPDGRQEPLAPTMDEIASESQPAAGLEPHQPAEVTALDADQSTRVDRAEAPGPEQPTQLDRGGPVAGDVSTIQETPAARQVRNLELAGAASGEEAHLPGLWRRLAGPLGAAGLLLLVAAAAWMLLGGRGIVPPAPVNTPTVAGRAITATGLPASGQLPSPTPVKFTATLIPPTSTPLLPADTPASVPVPPTVVKSSPTPTSRPVKTLVLWDSSHGPRISGEGDGSYDPSGLYGKLTDMLAKNGLTVQNSQQPLAGLDLSQYGAVVVNEWSAAKHAYSSKEAQQLAEYVRQGGGLLILADNPGLENVAPVAAQFGVTVAQSPAFKEVTLAPGHAATRGVKTLKTLYPGGALKVTDPAWVILGEAGGPPAAAALEQGAGRVVVIGDGNLFDNRCLDLADNAAFADNVFHWLVGAP